MFFGHFKTTWTRANYNSPQKPKQLENALAEFLTVLPIVGLHHVEDVRDGVAEVAPALAGEAVHAEEVAPPEGEGEGGGERDNCFRTGVRSRFGQAVRLLY